MGNEISWFGGLDLIGKAAVLKTAAGNRFGVRVPGPPLTLGANKTDAEDPDRCRVASCSGARATRPLRQGLARVTDPSRGSPGRIPPLPPEGAGWRLSDPDAAPY